MIRKVLEVLVVNILEVLVVNILEVMVVNILEVLVVNILEVLVVNILEVLVVNILEVLVVNILEVLVVNIFEVLVVKCFGVCEWISQISPHLCVPCIYDDIISLSGATSSPSNVKVTAESSSSIRVEWGPIQPCRDRNGNINNYNIKYQPVGGSGSVKNEIVSGVGSAGGQVLLDRLTSFTNYSIQVAAVNNQSIVGTFSTAVTGHTCEHCIDYTV